MFPKVMHLQHVLVKISAEKHVSKLLQSVLVCRSLISLSSRYAAVSLPLHNITVIYALINVNHNDVTLALDLICLLQTKGQ